MRATRSPTATLSKGTSTIEIMVSPARVVWRAHCGGGPSRHAIDGSGKNLESSSTAATLRHSI